MGNRVKQARLLVLAGSTPRLEGLDTLTADVKTVKRAWMVSSERSLAACLGTHESPEA